MGYYNTYVLSKYMFVYINENANLLVYIPKKKKEKKKKTRLIKKKKKKLK